MRSFTLSAALLFGLLCSAASPAQDGAFIQALQVRGTRRPVQLETHAGQTLARARLEADVRRLWATGWFEDIRVEATETPEGTHLVFTLVEKPRLYLRRVEFEPERERRPLALKPDDTVDSFVAQKVAAGLRQQLLEEGYRDALVEAELMPVGFQQADLRLRVTPGPRYRVEAVRFLGNPRIEPEELQRALRATRVKRALPGLPGLWKGWRLHPPFSQRAVDADIKQLHSFYLARGYFDARVRLAGVEFQENKARVAIAVDAGPRYRVRRLELTGTEAGAEVEPDLAGSFPVQELCRCLLAAQRRAEAAGALGFSARLEVIQAVEPPWAALAEQQAGAEQSFPTAEQETPPWVALRARVQAGEAYTVGRIEFRGHHSFSDLTLRRAWVLDEGDWFDAGRLRRSLARLNQMAFFEPLTESNVVLQPNPEKQRVNLAVRLQEKPRGRWALSGPIGQVGLGGPFQFTLGSRLPAWGRGPLELSTYFGTFSLLAFSQPVLRTLSLVPRTRWLPLLALERPSLPGQPWQSGFLVSPQLGWQATPTSYALTHGRNAALSVLAGKPEESASLTVPVTWHPSEEAVEPHTPEPVGSLSCERPRPRWAWLRAAGALAVNFLLSTSPL